MMTMNEEEGSQSEPSSHKAFIQLIKVRYFPRLASQHCYQFGLERMKAWLLLIRTREAHCLHSCVSTKTVFSLICQVQDRQGIPTLQPPDNNNTCMSDETKTTRSNFTVISLGKKEECAFSAVPSQIRPLSPQPRQPKDTAMLCYQQVQDIMRHSFSHLQLQQEYMYV